MHIEMLLLMAELICIVDFISMYYMCYIIYFFV